LDDEGSFSLVNSTTGASVNMRQQSSLTLNQSGTSNLVVIHSMSQEIDVSYSSGWNLVGLPLNQAHQSFMELFTHAISGTLFGFNGAYVSRTQLELGTGYWLRFSQSGQSSFSGDLPSQVSVSLSAGWNLISGHADCGSGCSIGDTGGIVIPGTIFGFNGAYQPVTTLQAGKGYWVRTSGAGTVTINAGSTALLADLPEPVGQPEWMSGATSVEFITDNEVLSTLYFGAELLLEHEYAYSLPPLPPQGGFDARFSTNRWVINQAEGVQIIVQQTDQPVMLRIVGSEALQMYEVMEYNELGWVSTHQVNAGDQVVLHESTTRVGIAELQESTAQQELPQIYALEQNYPNPFNPTTMIGFSLPESTSVTLSVYNVMGQRVSVVYSGVKEAGMHTVSFDAGNLSSGMYIYRLQAGSFVQTRKMMLMK
jgi:hypothetical protein